MKDKFSEVYRKNSGERYFEHLREVVNNVIDLPNHNIDKVLIALAHDSIEDIEDINFDFLKIII
jgi:(p)ppGpp synthase/HD superfamily hydrolase